MSSFAPPVVLRIPSTNSRIRRVATKLCYRSADLQRAISDGHLLDFGECIQLHPGGVICSPRRTSPPPWNPGHPWNDAIDLSVSLLQKHFKQALHSVYLRGSVSTGHAFLDGRSDIDLIVLLHPRKTIPISIPISISLSIPYREIDSELRTKFPFVRRADIAVHDFKSLPQTARFTLLAYAVHLFGPDIRPTLGCTTPGPDALINIRVLQRRSSSQGAWFLKRCLRGLVDAIAVESRQHARDIVACASILTTARPECAHLAVRAAIASASPLDGDMYEICHHMADWAEVEFLRANFGLHHTPRTARPPALAPSNLLTSFQQNLSNFAFAVSERLRTTAPVSERTSGKSAPFLRDTLRPIAITHLSSVREVLDVSMDGVFTHYAQCFSGQTEQGPIVYRNVLPASTKFLRDSQHLVEHLSNSYSPVDVRLASGPLFTFCRSQHPWYMKRPSYSPPSVVRRMSEHEFIHRARSRSEGILPNLVYPDERVYLQSDVLSSSERLYNLSRGTGVDSDITIAQDERRWVATHGSVSTLHYDCAHSVLGVLTGTKRMVFLPPSLLRYTRPYPEGHPLQRRCMLDITRSHAAISISRSISTSISMFSEFWEYSQKQPGLLQEVLVEAGDVVVFPPLWAHYTESLAEEGELCSANTMRFLLSE